MMKKEDEDLDKLTDDILREENPQAEAVRCLINVDERIKGKASNVELKTDLTADEVKIHSVLAVLSSILENGAGKFSENCIMSDLLEIKERKSLSKERKSRQEIVEVAKPAEIPPMGFPMDQQGGGFLKRFFTGKRNA